MLTEIYRADWGLDTGGVDQIFYSSLEPGALSAWHAHGETTDRLFVPQGLVQVVLYDARPDSPSHGRVNEVFLSHRRPTLVVIPPRVWHGVRNCSYENSLLLNAVDRAYSYQDPDHWRLPWDTDQIPFRFPAP